MPATVASVDDVSAVETRVAALESEPAPSPTVAAASSAPWVGAYVGDASQASPDYLVLWRAAQRAVGPLHVWRCFDSSIKSDPVTCRFHKVPNVVPFYSLKPPNGDHSGFAAGNYTAAYQAVINALPQGAFMTVWHEAEDDLTGAQYLAMTERAYSDAKTVRPDITYTYTSMAYQWETNSKGHTGTSDGWLEAAELVDMVTTDVYASAQDYKPMALDGGFARWMDDIVEPSGTPWGVSERGIHDLPSDTARADILAEDWLYACRNGAELFCYWNADWSGGNWLLDRPVEQALMRGIAAQGRAR